MGFRSEDRAEKEPRCNFRGTEACDECQKRGKKCVEPLVSSEEARPIAD